MLCLNYSFCIDEMEMLEPNKDLKTALYDFHLEQGGKMVSFAGYKMPIQYKAGIVKEHEHTRESVSIFDVSHMGQIKIKPLATMQELFAALEKCIPTILEKLDIGQLKYTILLNEEGGIIDDLMVTRQEKELYLVLNASRKHIDIPVIQEAIAGTGEIEKMDDFSLIALQGPKAEKVLSQLNASVSDLKFMTSKSFDLNGSSYHISRSGYTGEDGFEISAHNDAVSDLIASLMSYDDVCLAGLGARDTLRLEAGLCLYGQDINEKTTPVEAGLTWVIPKSFRESRNFNGKGSILKQLESGVEQKRVGIICQGKVIPRAGVKITDKKSNQIGVVTSGGYGPTVSKGIAMGYISKQFSDIGTQIFVNIRGQLQPAEIAALPFWKPNYKK